MKIIIVQNCAEIAFNDDSENTIDTKMKNFEKTERLIKETEEKSADLIVLPELFSTDWYPPIYPKSSEAEQN